MGLFGLNISEIDTAVVLDSCIVQGFQTKYVLADEYSHTERVTGEHVSRWIGLINKWTKFVEGELDRIFLTKSVVHGFLNAKQSSQYFSGENVQFGSLRNGIEGKIAFLQRIAEQLGNGTQYFYASQLNLQQGDGNKMEVKK